MTLRMEGHAVHDDAFYVLKELFEEWAKRDPIERFRSWLRENADMTDEEEDEVAAGVKRTLTQAIERAESPPLPIPRRSRTRCSRAPKTSTRRTTTVAHQATSTDPLAAAKRRQSEPRARPYLLDMDTS